MTGERMITSILLSCAVAGAAFAAEKPAKPEVGFPHTAFALPVADGIKVSWVLKPLEKDGVASKDEQKMRFDVDGRGKPWFGDGARRLLTSPMDDEAALSSTPFADFTFTSDGARVVCTDEYMGELKVPEKPRQERGVPVLQFWGRVKMSHAGCRLAPGGPGGVYVVWHNEKTGNDEVSVVKVEDGQMHAIKLFGIDTRIAAVAGDGDTTYVAAKNWIIRLPPDGGKDQLWFNAHRPVTGLAYSPEAGLFYATPDAVGFASPDFQTEMVKSPDPQIAIRGDKLYVRLGKTLGVVAISGIRKFQRFRWRETAKTPAKAE